MTYAQASSPPPQSPASPAKLSRSSSTGSSSSAGGSNRLVGQMKDQPVTFHKKVKSSGWVVGWRGGGGARGVRLGSRVCVQAGMCVCVYVYVCVCVCVGGGGEATGMASCTLCQSCVPYSHWQRTLCFADISNGLCALLTSVTDYGGSSRHIHPPS